MSMSKTWYIYCHTAPNGKRYIGQTRTQPEKRWQNGRGYSTQQYFKRAIDKYGWDSFKHVVLCSVSKKEYADFLEQWFIEKYDTCNPEHGYNTAKGGAGPLGVLWDDERKRRHSKAISGEGNPMYGRRHSAEARTRISERLCGRKLSSEEREFRTGILLESNKRRQTPIRQLDLEGNLIAVYPGMGDLERKTGYNHGNICMVCRGLRQTAYGFKWEYVNEELREDAKEVRANRKKSGIPVLQLDIDGNEIARYESATAAERETGFNRNKISACCHGKQATYAGFRWKFVSPPEQKSVRAQQGPVGVVQLDMDGVEIAHYASLADAMNATGHDRHRIVECCRGERGSYRECQWRYAEPTDCNQPQAGLFS